MADSEKIPAQAQYNEANIKLKKDIDHIRHRPGMYVGGVDSRALHHLVYEVVDNSIDEALAGRCDSIEVAIRRDGFISISDNGVGIPVGINTDTGKSTLEVVLTQTGSSGKFDSDAYKVSGGLHGVGLTAVNALSDELYAEVYREGFLWRQVHRRGIPQGAVEKIRPLDDSEPTGTTISFHPDYTVLEQNDFNFDTLADRFRQMAFVTRKVRITLRDERAIPVAREVTFYFEGGLHSYVRYLNRYRKSLHDPVYAEKFIEFSPEGKSPYNIGVEVAFQYNDTSNITELAFANTISTSDGGTHLTGLRSSVTSVINRFARKAGYLKEKDQNFSGNDTMEGITAIVSIKHPDPSFESQTKVKLLNPEVQGAVSQVTSEAFNDFLELNPREARKIIDKCMTSKRAREAARKARDLVRSGPSLLESSTLPGKLADCSTIGANAEIYIVEGDSAGGSAKQGRDRHFQAILPLRGKILNTERAGLDKILDSNEIKALISALGTGIHEDFTVEKLRYGRVIIMSVAGDEPTLVMNTHGETEFVNIGDFIDECIDGKRHADDYQVISFDNHTHATRFRPLKAVIRHSHEEAMYKLTTTYNRSIKVTASHSVFVFENGEVILKKGNEVKIGDYLVASKRLPRVVSPTQRIDLLQTFYNAGLTHALYVRGESVRKIAPQRSLAKMPRPDLWDNPRVELSVDGWKTLIAHREKMGLTQKQVAHSIGVKQPITISQWERAIFRPILPQFMSYLKAIDFQDNVAFDVLPSKMEQTIHYGDDSRNARWRDVSDYKAFEHFTPEELEQLDDDVQFSPQAYADKVFNRYLPITRELVWFLGWFVAEGTLSAHQISLNLGKKDEPFIPELQATIETVFGEKARCYYDPDSDGIKLYFHSVMGARLLKAWGVAERAHEKCLPDLVFGLSEALQQVFLEAYFLGDGTTAGQNLSMTTNSPRLKDGLLYLMGQLGLLASHTQYQPSTKLNAPIQTHHDYFTIAISSKTQLEQTRYIWQRHANAPKVEEYLAKNGQKAMDYLHISDDLMGIQVKSAEEIEPIGEYVYDFSVEDDENFICGVGGLCAHNTDADVDGSHIRTLLLTFFYRHMQPLVQNGHLYIAQPPIYLLKAGKDQRYFYPQSGLNDAQILEKAIKEWGKDPAKVGVQRYKGLGEMNPDQLWDTTMNPQTRTLLKVTIEDAAEADKVFDMLMGNAVPPRRRFIQTNAKAVKNLDI